VNLKNAVAVCLISLFSATLVVLIARALDSQAASQLEPQLTSIVDELRAIRKQGGVALASGNAAQSESVGDGLVVYYFHSNFRCPTCQAVESQAKATVEGDFAAELGRGQIAWKVLNYEKPAGAELARKFEVKDPVIVLAQVSDDQVRDWKRLDKAPALAGDKPALSQYLRDEIKQMLAVSKKPATAGSAAPDSPPAIPIPE
jgi:hypothetical protein